MIIKRFLLMRKFRKFALLLAAFMASCSIFAACDFAPYPEADTATQESGSLEKEESPLEEDDDSDDTSGDDNDDDPPPPVPDPQWEIVDALYALAADEYLGYGEQYELTGIVTKKGSSSGKNTLTFYVEGREEKPIYCFGIVNGSGVEYSSVKIGDRVTVKGKLTNYQGKTYEFDKNCQLIAHTPQQPDEGEGGESGGESGGGVGGDNVEGDIVNPSSYPQSNAAARQRTASYKLSGSEVVPDQAPTLAPVRPKSGNKYIHNATTRYSDSSNAYTVVDCYGEPSFTVFKDGAYITLEEVAAYVYAFGTYPANYTTSKSTNPSSNSWGKNLRVNHTRFSGDTDKYPFEPVLPNISGCGGTLQYYEMDIGTTGTDCDPSFTPALYNNGNKITRGAARIVYGKDDLNGNGIYERGELHVFYTYNHYNDFQEYLNYEGGWGEIFGNITGGGKISSTTNYNPTPYVEVAITTLPMATSARITPSSYKAILRAYF